MSSAILYTIGVSHFSEKIRWLLDHEQIPYTELPLTPAFHVRPMLKKGGRRKTTVPLLEIDGTAIQNSADIAAHLAQVRAPLKSVPPSQAEAIRSIERRFDEIGRPLAGYLYSSSFGFRKEILRIWTQFASPWQAFVLRLAFPLIRKSLSRKLRINPVDLPKSAQAVGDAIAWLESELADGRRYLVGNRLSYADIAAASILAPLACPAEHPIYGRADFQRTLASAAEPWRQSPALQWVREVYRQHRGPVWRSLAPHLLHRAEMR